MGAGRPGPPAVRRGRGQEGATSVARVPCPERGWLGQGLAPRKGWARAMGMPGVGVVMVGLVMLMRWIPVVDALKGLRVPKASRRLARCAGLFAGAGWVGWAMADPGLLGDGSGPAEAQTGDRGWWRFGSAGPDRDSGLVRRDSFEDQPRSAPVRTNPTAFRRPCPGGSPNGAAWPLSPATGAPRGRPWCCCVAGFYTSAAKSEFAGIYP